VPPWEAPTVLECRQEHETEELAHARNGLEPSEGLGLRVLGRRDKGQRPLPEPIIIMSTPGQVDGDALLHGRRRKPLGAPGTGGCVSDLFANLGHIVRAVGLLDMGQERRPFAPQLQAPPEQGARGPQGGGRDRGLRQQAPPQEARHFLGVARVVFGLATVDGLHRQRVPEDTSYPCAGHRSASQAQGQRHSTQTPRSSR
jgi:hypothetical protein